MDGWIKLYRKILDSDMYQNLNSKQRDVMITCLLLASHRESRWEYKGQIYTIQPGQFVTSLESLKQKCASDVSIKNIRTALQKLETWGFLTNQSTKTGRLITIVNWHIYQDEDINTGKDTGKEVAKNGQSIGKEVATIKNEKNDQECKEDIYVDPLGSTKVAVASIRAKDLIADLVAYYREITSSNDPKDYPFIGGLYNRYGYDAVWAAIDDLKIRLSVQPIDNTRSYLVGILKSQSQSNQWHKTNNAKPQESETAYPYRYVDTGGG